MAANYIAMAVALGIVYCALDEVMEPLNKAGASDGELFAMLCRCLRVMGGTALFVIAVGALILGSAA